MNTVQQNKEIIIKIFNEVLNKRNWNLLDGLISEEFEGIKGNKGIEAFKEPVLALIKSFPDVQWKLETLIGEGDHVAARWKVGGTHLDIFLGFAASGKTFLSDGSGYYLIRDRKIVSSGVQTDRISTLQQLGILPFDLSQLPYIRNAG